MTALEPPDDRIVIGFGHFCIAENAVLHPLLQGIDNGGCGTEIHIRHPHGQYIFLFGSVPFVGVRPATRDNRIEIVSHNLSIYS